MMAFHLLQACSQDAWHRGLIGAVKQYGWRYRWCIAKINRDAVALIGTNTLAIRTNGKALFGTSSDDVAQCREIKCMAGLPTLREQFGDADPALAIKRDADMLGCVTQDITKKFAQGGIVAHRTTRIQLRGKRLQPSLRIMAAHNTAKVKQRKLDDASRARDLYVAAKFTRGPITRLVAERTRRNGTQ